MELKGIRAQMRDLEEWKEGMSFQVADLVEKSRQAAAMSVIEISDDSSEEGEEEVQREPSPVRE